LGLEENLLRRAHGTLDVHLPNVLPLLLEQTRQKVSSQLGVDNHLFLVHLRIGNGNIQAHDLLHLELDRGLDLIDLLLHVVAAGEEGGELACLRETRSQETGDLLNHVVGGHEEVVLLGELLHQLLVLVQLLEVINTHVRDTNTIGLLAMRGVSEHAALEVGAGDGGETEGSAETLVTLGIVVLEGDLNLDGFHEVTLLTLDLVASPGDGVTAGVGEDVIDSLVEQCGVQLVCHFSDKFTN